MLHTERPARVYYRVIAGAGAVVLVALAGTLLGLGLYVVLAGPVVGALWALQARPQRGMLALALLVPFDGLLLIVPHGSSLSAWKEAVVLATLAATFVCPPEARGRPRRRLPSWTPALGLLMVLALVSAVFVGVVQGETGFRIDFFYVLLALAIWRCPPNPGERDALVSILMFDGVATSLVGIAQQFLGENRLHDLGYQYDTALRLAGSHLRSFSTFQDPFPFAFFLMIVILLCLPIALDDWRRPRNRLFLALLPVVALGLLSSIIRGAWLGTAVGLAYLGWRRHRAFFTVVPVALLGLIFLPGSLSASALSSTSLGERTGNWTQNISQVIAHPFGSGIGSAGAASLKVAALTSNTGIYYQPDNYYFKEVYELGPLGLWLFVLFLLAVFRASDRSAPALTGGASAYSLGFAAAVLAIAFASTVATYFEIYPMDLFFWLLLGVAATLEIPVAPHPDGLGGARPREGPA